MTSISQRLESELQLLLPHCFTDSKVALFWIQGVDKDWKPFVQNRVTEIRSLIHPGRWRHCSGRDNPADGDADADADVPSWGSAPLELSVMCSGVMDQNGFERNCCTILTQSYPCQKIVLQK